MIASRYSERVRSLNDQCHLATWQIWMVMSSVWLPSSYSKLCALLPQIISSHGHREAEMEFWIQTSKTRSFHIRNGGRKEHASSTTVLKSVVLKLEPQHHLGTCQKCTFSCPTPDPLKYKLQGPGQIQAIRVFLSFPGGCDVHSSSENHWSQDTTQISCPS